MLMSALLSSPFPLSGHPFCFSCYFPSSLQWRFAILRSAHFCWWKVHFFPFVSVMEGCILFLFLLSTRTTLCCLPCYFSLLHCSKGLRYRSLHTCVVDNCILFSCSLLVRATFFCSLSVLSCKFMFTVPDIFTFLLSIITCNSPCRRTLHVQFCTLVEDCTLHLYPHLCLPIHQLHVSFVTFALR